MHAIQAEQRPTHPPAKLPDRGASVRHLKNIRSTMARNLTRVVNKSREAMDCHRSARTLDGYRARVADALQALVEAQGVFLQQMATAAEQENARQWMQDRVDKADEVLGQLDKMLVPGHHRSRTTSSVCTSIRSESSQPSAISRSRSSQSSRATRLRLEAEQAQLELEQTRRRVTLEAQQEVERAELKARFSREVLEREVGSDTAASENLPRTKPEDLVARWLDKDYEEPVNLSPRDSINDVRHTDIGGAHQTPHVRMREAFDAWIDKLVPGVETRLQMGKQGNSSDHLVQAIVRIESERDLPKVDLPVFDGSPIIWPRFVEQFHVQVHCRPGLPDARRMDLLQSHIKGEARLMVQGLGYSGNNYAQALQELKRAFGHKFKVARAYVQQVTSGQPVPAKDQHALRKFYVSVRDCITILQQLNYTSELHSTETLVLSAKRIPTDKASRWNAYVARLSRMREPTLFDLQAWLQDCVSEDFNPYTIQGDKPQPKPRYTSAQPQDRRTTLMTSHLGSGSPKSAKPSAASNHTPRQQHSGEQPTCFLCHELHPIYRCPEFINRTVGNRLALCDNHHLCKNCLRPNHDALNCFSTNRCRMVNCGVNHHTLLHQPRASTKQTRIYHSQEGEHAQFQLVPVSITGQNGNIVHTVAMLDTGSDVSLVHKNLVDELGLKGRNRHLVIKTVNSLASHLSRVVSLSVRTLHDPDSKTLHIKQAWAVDSSAFHGPSQVLRSEWKHLEGLGISDIAADEVQLLIGLNVPEAHLQLDSISGQPDQPFAIRTCLGWSLMGVAARAKGQEQQARVNLTLSLHRTLGEQIESFWRTESFGCAHKDMSTSSIEDRRAMVQLDTTTRLVDGHYEVGMLWRNPNTQLPNSISVARRRFNALNKRLCNDEDFSNLYRENMNTYIERGYARKLMCHEVECLSPHTWYIPHHGVTHPNKAKLRIVFDAAAKSNGVSLNDNLMTGPDLLNSLFGVLQRFRLGSTALMADIEGMFHQVRVPKEDSDALRFLWKEAPKQPGAPDVYAMTVHIFGAADSPCCANYALRRTALDNRDTSSTRATQSVLRDFYVDDLLLSVETPAEAILMSKELIELLAKGGFRIHKWTSNSKQVIQSIPETERAVQIVDLALSQMPIHRALGLRWDLAEDTFIFDPAFKEVQQTKRVSIVSSIFDPCGYIAPFTFRAKCLIQELWRQQVDWDDPLPSDLQKKWSSWRDEVQELSKFRLQRHHQNLASDSQEIQLHVFSDASEQGFAAAVYLRYTTPAQIESSLLAAKTHISPIKPELSIPRLELQGAVLAVRLGNAVKKELPLEISEVCYWTDSNTVLRYLKNESRRFKPFVANRVTEILESSIPGEWNYIHTSQNPADCCTRGLSATALANAWSWLRGPAFLRHPMEEWPVQPNSGPTTLDPDDPEIKRTMTTIKTDGLKATPKDPALWNIDVTHLVDLTRFSSWQKLVRRTAWITRAIRNFAAAVSRLNISPIKDQEIRATEHQQATLCWTQHAQQAELAPEIDCLKSGQPLPSRSKLLPLKIFYDGRHLRIGGRLRKAKIPTEAKHQVVLPRNHSVTRLILHDTHVKLAHCGREHLIADIRQRFWPINARTLARRTIVDCRDCRRRKVQPTVPVMADLPLSRLDIRSGAFHHTGVDYFGPMMVKSRRSTVKVWGCLFTCLSIRAVHLELAGSLNTDDFILCLRRFIGRRGKPAHLYSDNGTNFKGAEAELKSAIQELEQNRICTTMTPQGIEWHFNPPHAPHFGGAWERLVRSVKTALRVVLGRQCVTETVLYTALIEVEAIINSRPLTHNSCDADDDLPLTPNHFLLGHASPSSMPCSATDQDIDSRKRWRQAQVLTNHITQRWIREYFPTLTIRHRWATGGRDIGEGDLVLLIDENQPRGSWSMGRISKVMPGDDGHVRTVEVRTVRGTYVRPAAKVCVLEENV